MGLIENTTANSQQLLKQFSIHQLFRREPDYMMPVMNGAEFAREIRGRVGFNLVPIVLITGGHAQRGKAAPELFNQVFEKPFKIDALIAALTELLGRDDTSL